MSYTLFCGHFAYTVTPSARRLLEACMYWVHCEKLAAAELSGAEKSGSGYTPEEIANLRHDLQGARDSLRDIMQKMDSENVPNWVVNGAMHWAAAHDLRSHYMREFFESSIYAVGGTT